MVVTPGAPAVAETPPPRPTPQIITTQQPGAPAAEPAEAERVARPTQVVPGGEAIVLEQHKGTLIRLPGPANTLFVGDSGIADVTLRTPTLVYLTAANAGETTLYILDVNGHLLLSKAVRVQPIPGNPIPPTVGTVTICRGQACSRSDAPVTGS